MNHEFPRLELDGHLLDWPDTAAVIWGETEQGRRVTLLGCFQTSSDSMTSHVHVHVALIGVHLASAEERAFRRIDVGLSALTDYATRGQVNAALPQGIANPLCPGERLSLVNDDSEEVYLRVESDEFRSWSGFGDTVQYVQDLLTLVGNADCRKDLPVLTTESGTRVDVKMKTETVIRDHWYPAFVLKLDDLPTVLPTWLCLREKLEPSAAVLFSVDYGGPGYYQNKLFNVASAAEGFSNALFPDATGIAPDSYAQLRQYLKQLPDKDARDWALSTVQRNKPGFKARMRLLLTLPDPDAVREVTADKEDLWAKWITQARNAISHSNYDDMKEIPPEIGQALLYVTKTLLHLVMLAELDYLSAKQQQDVAALTHTVRRTPFTEYLPP